jgi:hypothetical protein
MIDEARKGNPVAAHQRMNALRKIPLLRVNEESILLAEAILASKAMPARAATDAAHVAIATVHGIQLLMTWNCTHIANAEIEIHVRRICREYGYECPVICTPEELMQGA